MGVGVLVERWGEGGREETERERERERERKHTLPDHDNSEPKNAMPLTAATMQFRESA